MGHGGGLMHMALTPNGVLTLHGTDGIAQVLQMTYDASGLSLADQMNLALLWYDPYLGTWINAVSGNHGFNPVSMTTPWQGSWDSYSQLFPNASVGDLLGAYGVDIVNHIVWAAINHNSQFQVGSTAVPEIDPAGVVGVFALVAGMFGALERRR
jgi:hypothetical protein